MPPFAVALAPSKIRRAAVLLAACLISACLWRYFSGSLYALLQTALSAAAAYGLAEPRRSVLRICIDNRQQAELHWTDGSRHSADLLSGSLISPLFLALKWRCGRTVFSQALLPDMTDAESWRRLTVWARFGAQARPEAGSGSDPVR